MVPACRGWGRVAMLATSRGMTGAMGARFDRFGWVVAVAVLACLLVTAGTRTAEACGGMIFKDHEQRPGGMSDQQVLIAQRIDKTVMVVSVGYVGATSDFAFLFPLQKPTSQVRDADPSLFEVLEEETAPRVIVEDATQPPPPSGGGCGCLGAGGAKSADTAGARAPTVVIHERGKTETYEYVIIGGDDAQTVSAWLEKEGFKAPAELQAAIDGYLAKGWVFLAAKLLVSAAEGNLAPLELTFRELPLEELTYPFGLSAHSLAPGSRVSVTLYLMGPAPFLPVDYEVAPIDRARLVATSAVDSNYEDLFKKQTEGGGMVLEFGAIGHNPFGSMQSKTAKTLFEMFGEGAALLRLRTQLGAAQLKDSGFRPADATEAKQTNVHSVVWSGDRPALPEPSGSALSGWLVLAAATIARRRWLR